MSRQYWAKYVWDHGGIIRSPISLAQWLHWTVGSHASYSLLTCNPLTVCVPAASLMAGFTRRVTVLAPGDFSSTVQRLSTKYWTHSVYRISCQAATCQVYQHDWSGAFYKRFLLSFTYRALIECTKCYKRTNKCTWIYELILLHSKHRHDSASKHTKVILIT